MGQIENIKPPGPSSSSKTTTKKSKKKSNKISDVADVTDEFHINDQNLAVNVNVNVNVVKSTTGTSVTTDKDNIDEEDSSSPEEAVSSVNNFDEEDTQTESDLDLTQPETTALAWVDRSFEVRVKKLQRTQQIRQVTAVALIRAVQALRRIDEVLQRSTLFWTHLGLSTSHLSQMKTTLTHWISYASQNERLRQRLFLRLSEYSKFWSAFENCASLYCEKLSREQPTMFHYIIEMETRAGCMDTVRSMRFI